MEPTDKQLINAVIQRIKFKYPTPVRTFIDKRVGDKTYDIIFDHYAIYIDYDAIQGVYYVFFADNLDYLLNEADPFLHDEHVAFSSMEVLHLVDRFLERVRHTRIQGHRYHY